MSPNFFAPKPDLQRRLIFVVLTLAVFLAFTLNFMSFFVNWEDVVHNGVRTETSWWLLGDGDCEDHPWSRHVYLECERASGVGAVGSNVRPSDCIRVCNDDPCASSRRRTATITIWFSLISIGFLGIFLVLSILGFFFNVWLPLMAGLFLVTIITSVTAWFPFWLSKHGYVADCPNTAYCPNNVARCTTHGFFFMFIESIILVLGFFLTLFFDYIYLPYFSKVSKSKEKQLAIE